MKNENILIAGATGYLGSHIVNELKRQQYRVRAIVRNPEKLKKINANVDEILEAEITKSETIINCCKGIDTVITSVGITRQKDGLTYMDVDYQANLNLLNEAIKSGVKRFIYVFIFNAEKIQDLKIIQAKQKFVDALKDSGINYCLINPTGFFSDMHEFLDMARKGKVYLFGKGDCKINPIDGSDLAKVCVNAIESGEHEINAGGPEILTYTQIAETAFKTLNKPEKIMYIPNWIKNAVLFLLRKFTRVRLYGPVEFLMAVLTTNMVAPQYGTHTLENYFANLQNNNPMKA
ncbi:MAG TPA: SDR family oxidoreductase [Hanamia sp.]|nr:SDR family oxidoreductase [Hanamia sp.]